MEVGLPVRKLYYSEISIVYVSALFRGRDYSGESLWITKSATACFRITPATC